MMMVLFDLVMTTYQSVLLIYLVKKQIRQRPHSLGYDAGAVVAVVLFLMTIQYLHLPIPEAFLGLVPLVYAKLTSDELIWVCALWAVADIFLFLSILTLVSSPFDMQIALNGSVLSAETGTQIMHSLIGNAALTVAVNMIARLKKTAFAISRAETLLFILTLLLTFVINECFFITRLKVPDHAALLVGASCSFVVMLFTMILYERLSETAEKKRFAELTAQTALLSAEHQEELKGVYKNMLAEQHDLRHRIAVAEALLSSAEISSEQRSQVLTQLKITTPANHFFTGSIAVDAILKAKQAVMENAGITFEFIEYPLMPLPIPEQSFCLLLSNLLDNAIEGVMRLPAATLSRHIRLSFSKVWNMLFITCINDANVATIKRRGNDFLSSKDHPSLHGFGINSMKQIVADAEGTIEFKVGQSKFTVQIFLGGKPPC